MTHMFADWASAGHGAAIVGSRERISLRYFLPVLPPVTPITNLQTMNFKLN